MSTSTVGRMAKKKTEKNHLFYSIFPLPFPYRQRRRHHRYLLCPLCVHIHLNERSCESSPLFYYYVDFSVTFTSLHFYANNIFFSL